MTGIASKTPRYVDIGLKSLRWLVARQTSAKGHFRPVGTGGFGDRRQPPRAVRPATAGGRGNHRGLPRRMARRS